MLNELFSPNLLLSIARIRTDNGKYDACNVLIEKDGTVNFMTGCINLLKSEYLINGKPYDAVIKTLETAQG